MSLAFPFPILNIAYPETGFKRKIRYRLHSFDSFRLEWDFVNGFMSGKIPRNVFWEYAKFKHPTHQVSFHTVNALRCLKFERSEPVRDRETER